MACFPNIVRITISGSWVGRNCIQRRRNANSMLKNRYLQCLTFMVLPLRCRDFDTNCWILCISSFIFESCRDFRYFLRMASDRVMSYITIQRLRNEKNAQQLDEVIVFPSRHALPLLATTPGNPFSNTQNTHRQTIRVLLILLSWGFFSLVLFSTLSLPF